MLSEKQILSVGLQLKDKLWRYRKSDAWRLSLVMLSALGRLNGLHRLIGDYQGSMSIQWLLRIDLKQSPV
jgi:hypothetical protein